MGRINVFENLSLDGFFSGKNGDFTWAHSMEKDDEWEQFVTANGSKGGALLFGRVTYDLMVKFWPTPAAAEQQPALASAMNARPKFVVSSSLKKVDWNNTTILKDIDAVKQLKESSGDDLTVLGSGSLVVQLADEGLVDAFQLVTVPLALGEGRSLFEGLGHKINMKMIESRAFKNGNVVNRYDVVPTP